MWLDRYFSAGQSPWIPRFGSNIGFIPKQTYIRGYFTFKIKQHCSSKILSFTVASASLRWAENTSMPGRKKLEAFELNSMTSLRTVMEQKKTILLCIQ